VLVPNSVYSLVSNDPYGDSDNNGLPDVDERSLEEQQVDDRKPRYFDGSLFLAESLHCYLYWPHRRTTGTRNDAVT